ncbi:hypothetical protein D9Q98_006852 [Chlorella vulgaris]|uniref:glutaredoxin-dependent peroxiredoxin n=1 Tax=Chlorella vulgaris TaxID=3077 RepID=A0A9D4TIY0_CHLVU|nr:hypothetical protein D9Q98_006852 [Chlorella vulgaris]
MSGALVGKQCPAISGLTFIKGDPMPVPCTTGPTVIEFWATWCGPCRAAFPHLSELQRRHRGSGLKVVGVNMEEASPKLSAFVAQQGEKMDYTVAVDSTGQAAQVLLGAAGVSGIPHAFIIDRSSKVRHHGHPMEPAFAAMLDTVCGEAAAAGGGGGGGAGTAPQRELPPVTSTREELAAMPVRQLKQILGERGIGFADLNEKAELVQRILERCANVTYYSSSSPLPCDPHTLLQITVI